MRVVILEKEVESCKDCPHCNFSFALFKQICCHPEFEINDLRKPEVSEERIPEGCPFLSSESRKLAAALQEEVSHISCEKIASVVTKTLSCVPDYFYKVPSSSSGKYHPEDEICEGGLVMHTLRCVCVAKEMARMYDLSKYDLDLCIAALILHDVCKNGVPDDLGATQFHHPIYAAKLVLEANPKDRTAKKVANLISSHMGRWRTCKGMSSLPRPKTNLQKFVALCDYIASRKKFYIPIKMG